jgi:carbon-monoxide dehydrogenase medium subunit
VITSCFLLIARSGVTIALQNIIDRLVGRERREMHAAPGRTAPTPGAAHVKPSPFDYAAPTTVTETVDLLARHGYGCKIIAGGQSLVPLMNLRFAAPEVLIDINHVSRLDNIQLGPELVIGAIVRQAEVERSSEAGLAVPLLHEALRHLGHVAIRNRGTIAGSIAHADPAAELPAVLLALDGDVIAAGPRGERRIPAREFFHGFFTTALEPDELVTSVRLPVTAGGSAVEEVARRHGDFALAGAAVHVVCDGATIASARIALFGVDSVPVRADAAEALLEGQAITDADAFASAAREAAGSLEPADDAQVPGAYRKRIAAVVTRRALERATRQASAEEDQT